MGKRKVKDLDNGVLTDEPRRSSRRISTAAEPTKKETAMEKPKSVATNISKKGKKESKPSKGATDSVNGKGKDSAEPKNEEETKSPVSNGSDVSKPSPSSGKQYWLMKAEPESRIEKGKDIKFSIDDLASKGVPEPWDGIRAYPARNNLRAMKKGDLAFFYHSSCKVPAIVGTMEIVEEHTPDLTAHDPSAPYYDASSTPESPKWSVVHVKFRQKLETPITLKDLRAFQAEKGSPLENMQMLKLTRLSVSKVSAGEWEFLTGIMEKNGDKIL